MAFGNPKFCASTFRQELRRSLQRSTRGPNRSARIFREERTWIQNYSPPLEVVDRIRLLPASYETPIIDVRAKDFCRTERGEILTSVTPYFEYESHWHDELQRSIVCSAGPLGRFRGKGEACYGCDLHYAERRAKRDRNQTLTISRSKRYAFSALWMDPVHFAPKPEKNYSVWQKCGGAECSLCAARFRAEPGVVLPWSVGSEHLAVLEEAAARVAKHCRTCGQENVISTLAWICQNERCGEAVIDLRMTSLSETDIEKLTLREVQCKSCRHFGFLRDIYECSVCSRARRLGESATLFDVDLTVGRVRVANGPERAVLHIETSAPKPLETRHSELARALDLSAVFARTPLDRQSELFGQTPSDHSRNTSGPLHGRGVAPRHIVRGVPSGRMVH